MAMAGTVYPGSKFSIHSILGDANAAVAGTNAALHPSPGAATLVSMQEAALRAAYCAPYSAPCPTVPTTAATAAFHPAPHQFNSAAAVLRPHPQQTPMAWQPVTFYQDPRSWHLTANTDSLNGYSQANCHVGCYGYDTQNVPLSTAHSRPPFSFGALKLKRKKTRTVFTRAQIDKLETTFNGKRYLSSNDRVQLALALKMTETQVKVWFQNRRNKWKREMANKSVSGGRQDEAGQEGGRLSASLERSDESDVDVASEIGSEDSADLTSSSQGVSNTSTSPGPFVPFGVVCR